MKILDLFWLFIIISAFAPLIQRRSLEAKRLSTLRRIEADRGSRLIALIHRQETLSFLGFPLMRYIDIHDINKKPPLDDLKKVLRDLK